MKKIAFMLVALIVFSLGSNSCKKDELESREIVIPEQYAKKWLVNNNDRAVDYISIEITQYGYYFIVFDDNTYITGSCYVDTDDNIILVGYGYIEILDLGDEGFSFILHLDDNDEPETIFTTAAQEMDVTDETELLCTTWHITEYYFVSGGETTWVQPSDTYNYSTFDVTFTTYGTYFTHQAYTHQGTPGELYDNRYWQWTNDDNEAVCYGLTESEAQSCGATANVTTLTGEEFVLEGSSTNIYGQTMTYYIKGTTL